MFASATKVAQDQNLIRNQQLEDEGRSQLESESQFIIPSSRFFFWCKRVFVIHIVSLSYFCHSYCLSVCLSNEGRSQNLLFPVKVFFLCTTVSVIRIVFLSVCLTRGGVSSSQSHNLSFPAQGIHIVLSCSPVSVIHMFFCLSNEWWSQPESESQFIFPSSRHLIFF